MRERSSRLESPWPEVSQGHCIPQRPEILERDSELLTERAGDCACESLALSARGEIHELCVSPLLPAAKINDAPNARNANGVFRKTVMLRPLDDISQCRRLGELGDHGLRSDSDFRSRNFERAVLDTETKQLRRERDF